MKSKPATIIFAAVLLAVFISDTACSNTGTIDEVLSGDLVRIGDSFIARLTGIKAPPRNEIMGYRIYDFTKREIEGKKIKLFTWTTDNTAARRASASGPGRSKSPLFLDPLSGEPRHRVILDELGAGRVAEGVSPDAGKYPAPGCQ